MALPTSPFLNHSRSHVTQVAIGKCKAAIRELEALWGVPNPDTSWSPSPHVSLARVDQGWDERVTIQKCRVVIRELEAFSCASSPVSPVVKQTPRDTVWENEVWEEHDGKPLIKKKWRSIFIHDGCVGRSLSNPVSTSSGKKHNSRMKHAKSEKMEVDWQGRL
jgi:hypothetical protein